MAEKAKRQWMRQMTHHDSLKACAIVEGSGRRGRHEL